MWYGQGSNLRQTTKYLTYSLQLFFLLFWALWKSLLLPNLILPLLRPLHAPEWLLVLLLSVSPLLSVPPWRMDRSCFCELWGTQSKTCVLKGNGWIICCHFSLQQINWINPMGRRQFPLCCHVFEHNLYSPSLLSLHSSFPVSAPSPLTCSHFTGDSSACWCIITNLQIMSLSPSPSCWIIYQREAGWHLHPSAVKAGFLHVFLKGHEKRLCGLMIQMIWLIKCEHTPLKSVYIALYLAGFFPPLSEHLLILEGDIFLQLSFVLQ